MATVREAFASYKEALAMRMVALKQHDYYSALNFAGVLSPYTPDEIKKAQDARTAFSNADRAYLRAVSALAEALDEAGFGDPGDDWIGNMARLEEEAGGFPGVTGGLVRRSKKKG
jgi:uncharacterized protein YidB (DUF937 family)